MTHEEIATALIAEGDRRRDAEGYGVYGEGLSRDERDQWHEAADFVRGLSAS